MGLFDAFRVERYPTRYGDFRSAAHLDLPEAVIFALLVIVILSFLLIIPGIRGFERLTIFVRVMFSIFVTTVIILTNFATSWNVAEIDTQTQYKAGSDQQINASIGLWIGLRGINVTLQGTPEDQNGEHIDYNEYFTWAWQQGKPGYGPDAGILQKQYYDAMKRGVPYPITWAIDYLTYDGEGIRYGRFYRIAGWYTHIFLWLSLPLWLLSNILMFTVIRYGAMFMGLSGASMTLSTIIYACTINTGSSTNLSIPFENGELKPVFGWCFYLILITGIICMAVSIVILFMDLRYPEEIASFFGADALQDYEEYYIEYDENEGQKQDKQEPSKILGKKNSKEKSYENILPKKHVMPLLRKRSTSFRFQKSRKRVTILDPHSLKVIKLEEPTYENVGLKRMELTEEEEVKSGSKEQIV